METKKKERLDNSIKAFQNYIDRYPTSKKIKDAESIFKNIRSEIDLLNKQQITL